MNIPRGEIVRYLGAKSEEGISGYIDEAVEKAATLSPKHIGAELNIADFTDNGVLLDNGLLLSGELAKNSLQGCRRVIILAATLTLEGDVLLSQADGAIRQAVMNSTLSAAIEAYLDNVEEKIAASLEKQNQYITKRFSPGYYDLPITLQKEILTLTDAEKFLGIHLTESMMLIPVKSVTAVIGVSDKPVDRSSHHCENCVRPCVYRKL